MATKSRVLILLLIVILLGAVLAFYFRNGGLEPSQFLLSKAVPQEIKVAVSTNGIIEPSDRSEVYASIDGIVADIRVKEGEQVARGALLMRLESEQIRSALAEARTALLQQRRQARLVTAGPPAEEVNELEASIAECALQLEQQNKDLALEESLYSKGAVTREAVEVLRKQRDLLQLRAAALKKKKQDLELRYAPEEKTWEQDKLAELAKRVHLLEEQLRMESVVAPRSGLIYSIPVKAGSYAGKGQLLAQIYEPGRIRLRAYVDEPDLGRIAKGQPVLIEWDGLPNRKWTGVVDKPAGQVAPLNNRSVGNVLCAVDGNPEELIPNLNVRVEIVTARKEGALVIPRAAVFNRGGKPAVMLWEKTGTVIKPVALGLVGPEEVEIIQGIAEGDSVVLNHGEAKAQ